MKRSEKRFISYHLMLLVLTATLLMVMPATFSWFSSRWDSAPEALGFTTGEIEYPEMTAYTFYSTEEGSTGGEWEAQSPEAASATQKLNAVGDTPSGTAAYLKTLQFGTIDNLLEVKEDNTLYLCFKVDRTRFGDGVTVSVKGHEPATGYPFELYDGKSGTYQPVEGDGEEDDPYLMLDDILNGEEGRPLFKAYYALTVSELTPGGDGFDGLTFTEAEEGEATATNTGETDFYYFWLKLTPDLDTFVKVSKALNAYMPCVILYDLQINLSFRNFVTGN